MHWRGLRTGSSLPKCSGGGVRRWSPTWHDPTHRQADVWGRVHWGSCTVAPHFGQGLAQGRPFTGQWAGGRDNPEPPTDEEKCGPPPFFLGSRTPRHCPTVPKVREDGVEVVRADQRGAAPVPAFTP